MNKDSGIRVWFIDYATAIIVGIPLLLAGGLIAYIVITR